MDLGKGERSVRVVDWWVTVLGIGLWEEETRWGFVLTKMLPPVSTKYLQDDVIVWSALF
jgi:hypothetical protein